MKLISNVKIWDDFRKGSDEALSEIYFQNIQKLFHYGKKFTNNEELIKDTIQELFIDLIDSRQKLGKKDNISFYLFASLRRKLHRQTQKNNLFVYTEEDEKLIENENGFSTEDEIIHKESLTQRETNIKMALSKLSIKQREILYYKYTCDFSYDEICELMSLKYDSARKQVTRALKSLRSYL